MERTHASLSAQAEDLLRLLSSALTATRLYPLTSPIRAEAIAHFVSEAAAITAITGPVQYYVDRNRFVVSSTAIGETLPQVSALAELLHALQVRQIIVAPGLTTLEAAAFLDVISGDTHAIRASGGVRAAVLAVGVANIALIEVSLRASEEAGLLGLDLTTAPLEDIAGELQNAVSAWSVEDAGDVVAESIDRFEPAARDLAMRRCAEALLLLDEATRLQMLSSAMPTAPGAPAMDGMLGVVAHMPPAALARLLQLTASKMGETPNDVLGKLELPPELAVELTALLKPSPRSDEARGIPEEANVVGIAAEVAESDDDDLAHIAMLVKATTGRAAAARGLSTALRMASGKPSEENVKVVADAMRAAMREGAMAELASAAAFLGGLVDDPALGNAARAAQSILHEQALLEACARRLAADPSDDAARTLMSEAGAAGAEALVSAYLDASELQRAHLLSAASGMLEGIAPVAGRILRSGDAASAGAVLRLLGSIGSRRLVPTIGAGLEHVDVRVREAAVVALANSPGPESSQLLLKALVHWDPETRRIGAREIGRTRNEDLLPALLKIIGEVNLFERNYELKKEVLKSLEALHSPRAVPVLRKLAHRTTVVGKKNRELRYLARRVLESLE